MNMNKIAMGVVLYNPDDKKRLQEAMQSFSKQDIKIYVYDNSTIDINVQMPSEVTYITENKNAGIAHALNVIMSNAEKDGYEWVITMDQDSILPVNSVSIYQKYLNVRDVAIICPQVIDKRRKYMHLSTNRGVEYIDFCITSASCTSIKIWKELGGFDEWLFIDLVDNEYCKRVISSGYKILRINSLILNQEFGKITPKNKYVQAFWYKIADVLHNQNFGKLSYKKNVSAMRVYYTNRNIIYVNRKLKKYGRTAYENYHCKGYLGFCLFFNLPSVLRAKRKIDVIKAIIRGTKDGSRAKVNEWIAPIKS